MPAFVRRLPVGAEIVGNGVHFRVWAPRRQRIDVALEEGGDVALAREADGYHAGLVAGLTAGARYRFRLDGGGAFPDPASRHQPDGPEGASEVVDPDRFGWSDGSWKGLAPEEHVYYELHVGTFTPEGTFRAAIPRLRSLVEVGVTTIELMPIADFAGDFGWGYDGVDLFAPYHGYGAPDDLRALVDAAHGLGLAVVLDVVYNHFGPRGCFLREFSDHYFSDRYDNEWGDPINYDGPCSAAVRELVIANVAHWIREYHLDGLRLDATQQIFDASEEHIVAAIVRAARDAAPERRIVVVAENEPQHSRIVRAPEDGGRGADGLWNDDFHHTARVAATGRAEAYLTPYHGSAGELLACAKWGFLYQGQLYPWQKARRGTPALDLEPWRFVHFLENHDQVANAARGLRLRDLTSPGRLRALTALLLLMPQTPLLFQGQEWGSSAPFTYFADHPGELGEAVDRGRREFLGQFPSLKGHDARGVIRVPGERATFEACKLDWQERGRRRELVDLHRDLLRLRREDPTLRASRHRGGFDGAVLGDHAFVLRFFGAQGDDRLLLVNLGAAHEERALAEPLVAPPVGRRWSPLWSSEAFAYGGAGTPQTLDRDDEGWVLPGECTVLLGTAEHATGSSATSEEVQP